MTSKPLTALILVLILLTCEPALGFPPSGPGPGTRPAQTGEIEIVSQEVQTAPVIVDGHLLFNVAGVSAFPATRRAEMIRDAIVKAARNEELDPDTLKIETIGDRSRVIAGDTHLVTVLNADAMREGIDRQLLAEVYRERIIEVIGEYREDREPGRLGRSIGFAAGYVTLLVLLIWGVHKVFKRLERMAERHVKHSLRDLERKSHRLLHAGRLWMLLDAFFRAVRWILVVLFIYVAITRILDLFPWTRALSESLLSLFIKPLNDMWQNLVEATPGLIFILVLFLVLRYLLKLMRLFFHGVELGTIRLANFEPDWAMPTFKIARIVLIALGVVIAYPYIPGSDSLAFKGISVFVGVLLSIGSSSVITNTFAGLSMIYRSAFKVGDRVQIDEVTGLVTEIKLQTTQIVTAKNETVVIPNSNIMNANVVNFSQLARQDGLIVHSSVGIGYDVPWRQVEAMLLEAAARTDLLEKKPAPFVLRRKLGDFAIEYEVNAYCSLPDRLPEVYSALHDNILDVFNERQVQIMSPAYVADPEQPKVAPSESFSNRPQSG